MIFMIIIFFFFGLIVGSFLNVVIFRFATEESPVSGRSRCDACRKTIPWYDNVPLLSFLLLRGKCRECGAPISWQHPAVELSTALLFSAVGRTFYVPGNLSSGIETVFLLGLVGALTVIFVYDLRHMEIPVPALVFGIVWTLFSLFLLWLSASPSEGFLMSGLWEGLVGGAVAFSLFYALVFFSKETWMGEGDAWLALLLGLVVGWKLLLPALALASGSGAIVGIALMAFGGRDGKSRMPFGPFLAASVLFVSFFDTMVLRMFGFL